MKKIKRKQMFITSSASFNNFKEFNPLRAQTEPRPCGYNPRTKLNSMSEKEQSHRRAPPIIQHYSMFIHWSQTTLHSRCGPTLKPQSVESAVLVQNFRNITQLHTWTDHNFSSQVQYAQTNEVLMLFHGLVKYIKFTLWPTAK